MPRNPVPPLATALAAGSLLALSAGLADAAAIERSVPSTARILFEKGSYAEFGFTWIDPHQTGQDADLTAFGIPVVISGNTGDLFEPLWSFSGAWKADLSDRLSYAILFDQPYGANTLYGQGSFPASFSYDGTEANLNTYQLTGVLAYDVTPQVKLYGGLRAEGIDADAAIPFIPTIAGYTVDTNRDWGFGYLVGAAYQRPEIALRVALTYYSEIRHSLDTNEFTLQTGNVDSVTEISTPQSVSLDVQTGIADKTLAFGSVRWVAWSDFQISPKVYTAGTGQPLVEYQDDWWTYTVGVGRQLTDALAGSLAVSYEPPVGGSLTTLGPYDGKTTLTAALSYDYGPANITGGVTYGKLGDTSNQLNTQYDDGSIWGLGLRLGYSF